MRILTFLQLAENQKEMSFDSIRDEMQITEEEVESFIIEGRDERLARDSNTFGSFSCTNENDPLQDRSYRAQGDHSQYGSTHVHQAALAIVEGETRIVEVQSSDDQHQHDDIDGREMKNNLEECLSFRC